MFDEEYFEYETYLSKEELAEFLKGLAKQVESGNEITLKSDEWNVKAAFTEPVEVEIEHYEDELEIKIKFRRRVKIRA